MTVAAPNSLSINAANAHLPSEWRACLEIEGGQYKRIEQSAAQRIINLSRIAPQLTRWSGMRHCVGEDAVGGKGLWVVSAEQTRNCLSDLMWPDLTWPDLISSHHISYSLMRCDVIWPDLSHILNKQGGWDRDEIKLYYNKKQEEQQPLPPAATTVTTTAAACRYHVLEDCVQTGLYVVVVDYGHQGVAVVDLRWCKRKGV